MTSQERIEEIMADAARASRLIELRFNTRALRLVEGGEADAARAVLDIELAGDKGLQCLINCYFRADIESHLGDRSTVLFFVANEAANGVLQPLDANGRRLYQVKVDERTGRLRSSPKSGQLNGCVQLLGFPIWRTKCFRSDSGSLTPRWPNGWFKAVPF